jgi:Domain of unknown function (DUF4390)
VLPGSPPRPLRRLAARAALLALAVTPIAARALEVAVGPPHERDGVVWCEARLRDVFAARVRESLERGMPATLELHAELWRRRTGWFDRLEDAFDASLRVRFEVWNDTYRVERAGARSLALGSLDSVAMTLERPLTLPLGRGDRIVPGARYYAVVTATLRPLSIEDVEEIEGWLSGEVVDKRRAGFGGLAGLPRSAFDAVRNFAGLGDERARTQTDDVVLRARP